MDACLKKNLIKDSFSKMYPGDTFFTTEYFCNSHEVDYHLNLCDRTAIEKLPKFNMVVCQATFEHLYDPYSAMLNLTSCLTTNGILTIHTHVPGFFYHPHPRDYIRFYPDWFIDAAKFFNVELLELCYDEVNIFSAYRKV